MNTAMQWDGHAGQLVGCSVLASSASSHSMRAGSSGILTLMAAWQAMEAAMRVRAASRFSACAVAAGLFQDFDQHAFEFAAFEARPARP